jgi:DNA-binding PadR family transcriptional regulator
MSARHALLGLLLDRAGYPYQLADRLQRRLGPAWEVNSGQLYQTVKSLERDGLIERVRSAAGDHEDRHVFAITDEGVSEFERWFDQAPDTVRLPRRPLLVKITFAGPRHLKDALSKVDAYERECARRLAETARLREELPVDTPEGAPHGGGHPEGHTQKAHGKQASGPLLRADRLLLRLNLSTDVFQLEGELRWARQARELLTWLQGSEAVWPSDSGERQRERGSARRELFTRMAGSEPAPAPAPPAPAPGGRAPDPGEDAPGD